MVIGEVQGNVVKKLNYSNIPVGKHSITFNGQALPEGLYVCEMTLGEITCTKRIELIK